MKNSDEVRIKYAAKQARIANAWKKWIGQIDGLKRMNAISVKNEQENNYTSKAKTDFNWSKKYGNLTNQMNQLVKDEVMSEFKYSMAIEYFYVGTEYFKLIRTIDPFLKK